MSSGRKTPAEIARLLKIHRATVSRIVSQARAGVLAVARSIIAIAPKRTSGLKSSSEGWVEVGHSLNKGNASFDDIVDLSKDRLRHGQPKRFRSFQIDQQLELIWLLDG